MNMRQLSNKVDGLVFKEFKFKPVVRISKHFRNKEYDNKYNYLYEIYVASHGKQFLDESFFKSEESFLSCFEQLEKYIVEFKKNNQEKIHSSNQIWKYNSGHC